MKPLQYFICCLVFSLTPAHASEVLDKLYSLASLNKTPAVFERKVLEGGMQSLYFEGAKYQGNPTRIFSYYKAPKGKGPFPAMVLVHGGGGSAFKEWVTKWNEAGFAAISIATEGQTGTLTGKKQPKWVKHEWGGPRRPGIYNDADKPLNDQWMNQATTAVIQAHNLLRSFKEINKDQIGISGISWGGVITSTAIGFDQRFSFAIPIYGCGFLDGMQNKYGKALANNKSYRDVWEPAHRISHFKNPTLWMTGLKENNFSLDAQADTYKLLNGEHYQSIQPTLKHSHKHGWAPKEPYDFAHSVLKHKAMPTFYGQTVSKGAISINVNHVDIESSKQKDFSTFYYTNDTGHTLDRKWQTLPVQVNTSTDVTTLNVELPQKATAWIFNIKNKGLTYSSELFEPIK